MGSTSDQALQETIVEPRSASAPEPGVREPEPGPEIGRYLVIDEIGSGGMGRVFRAYDPKLGREVALKCLRVYGGDERGGARMLREAKAMALLSHPNVVPVYDVDIDHGTLFIAMEYVRGTTLKTWLARRRRGWREALAMFVQAGRGLAAAHAQGIVHRDFKPSNVVIGEDPEAAHASGRPRVMDFGLARAVGDALDDPLPDALAHDPALDAFDADADGRDLGATLTAHGTVVGTPPYMAPEQHMGEAVDARVDQYAFCIAVWEALHRRPAFAGRSASELAAAKLAGPPRPPPSSGIPTAVHTILARGLMREPAERWPDMNALLDALERVRNGRRRRWILVAIPAVGLVAALAWWRSEPPCLPSDTELDGVWDLEARARVEQALLDSKASYAATTLERVTTTLDQQAEAWAAMHRDTCEATKVRHEQSDEALDLRMGCLRAHRQELGAVVELLAAADAAVTERAVEVAAGLPPLARCADVAALRERVPPPEQAAVRERVDDVRARLEQARLQSRAGRPSDALATAEAAHADAKASGYEPVAIEAEIEVASIMVALNRAEEAQPLLEHGLEAALVHRDQRSAAAAALELVEALGRQGIRNGQTEWLVRAALGLAEGDGSDPRLVSRALAGYGGIFADRELEVDAERYAAEAVARLEQALGPDHPDLIEPLVGHALIVRALGRLEDAAALRLRALALAERAYGSDHPQVAEPLRLIGFDALVHGDGAGALAAFDRVAVIYEGAFGPDHPSTIQAQGLRATALAQLERYDEAVAVAEQTLARMDRGMPEVHSARANVMHNLATIFALKGDHARAVEILREVVRLRRAIGHRSTLSASLDSFGRQLEQHDELAEAEQVFAEAAEIEAAVHADDGRYNTGATARLAALVWRRGELVRARELLESALARVADDDTDEHVEARYMLGQLLWEMNDDRRRAVELVERAYERTRVRGDRISIGIAAEMRAWLDAHVLPAREDPLAR